MTGLSDFPSEGIPHHSSYNNLNLNGSTMTSSLAQTLVLVPELLSKIFFECLPSILSPPVLSIAPLNMSLVCRSWRTLALVRPDLWATIQLSKADLDHWFDAYPNRHLPLYRLLSRMWSFWKDRSRNAPLDMLLELDLKDRDLEICDN